jgi:hypothetical protein
MTTKFTPLINSFAGLYENVSTTDIIASPSFQCTCMLKNSLVNEMFSKEQATEITATVVFNLPDSLFDDADDEVATCRVIVGMAKTIASIHSAYMSEFDSWDMFIGRLSGTSFEIS